MSEILISESWLELKPNEDEDGNYESFEEYYCRIKLKIDYQNIPECVFKQWIYELHRDFNTLKNYAWINFKNVKFELNEWSFEEITNCHVITSFQSWVASRSNYSNFNQFAKGVDLDTWKAIGTWRTPPIIIDVAQFKEKCPTWAELKTNWQLVEGHTRLGHLISIHRIAELGNVEIARKHKVWIMTKK